jgi:hypothetical protein
MKITLDIEFEVDYLDHEAVTIKAVRFPNCRQNLLMYLSRIERIKAQAELEAALEQQAIDKVITICEKRVGGV